MGELDHELFEGREEVCDARAPPRNGAGMSGVRGAQLLGPSSHSPEGCGFNPRFWCVWEAAS